MVYPEEKEIIRDLYPHLDADDIDNLQDDFQEVDAIAIIDSHDIDEIKSELDSLFWQYNIDFSDIEIIVRIINKEEEEGILLQRS